MKRRKLNWKILAVVAVVVIGGFALKAGKSNGAEPIINKAQVVRDNITASVSGNGVLEAVTTVDVRSNVGGQVVTLAVDEGDYVKAGQLIAKIDPSDSVTALQQAEADLAAANAKVAQAREGSTLQDIQTSTGIQSATQALESAKQRLAQAEQQARVQPKLTNQAVVQAKSSLDAALASQKQTKVALAPQKLASAKASYDQAKATYDQAERELRRQQTLFKKGFVAQSQVDAAEQQFGVAKAQLANAKEKLDTVKDEADQDVASSDAKVAQAKAAYETALANRVQDDLKRQDLAAAKAAYKQAQAALASAKASAYQNQIKRGDILQARAQLERARASAKNARTQLGYTTILAPRSGVVTKKYVDVGSIVTGGRSAIGGGGGAGISIVEIADVSTMWVVVNVDETDIARISNDQMVDITVDAYPDEVFEGTVIKIAPQAVVDQNVTTVPVTVEIQDGDARLKPAMNASCDFITERKENVLQVPSEAVNEGENSSTVTVLAKDGKQITRRVQTGIIGNETTEIIAGLKEGETVITSVVEATDATASPQSSGRGGRRGGPPRMF